MFDFTSLYHSEHAAKIYERRGRRLLATVVGDSLLEVWVSLILKCALSCFMYINNNALLSSSLMGIFRDNETVK